MLCNVTCLQLALISAAVNTVAECPILNYNRQVSTVRFSRDAEVDAILSEDVSRLLGELGIRDKFERGEYQCHVCNDIMSYENLKLIFPLDNDQTGFVCNKPECFVEFILRP